MEYVITYRDDALMRLMMNNRRASTYYTGASIAAHATAMDDARPIRREDGRKITLYHTRAPLGGLLQPASPRATPADDTCAGLPQARAPPRFADLWDFVMASTMGRSHAAQFYYGARPSCL